MSSGGALMPETWTLFLPSCDGRTSRTTRLIAVPVFLLLLSVNARGQTTTTTTKPHATTTTTTTLPRALTCENSAARHVRELAVAVGRCHIKSMRATGKGRTFDLNRCEDKAKERYRNRIQRALGCVRCLNDGNRLQNAGDRIVGMLDHVNEMLPNGFTTGPPPSSSNSSTTTRCKIGLAKSALRLVRALTDCRIASAIQAFNGQKPDEDGCRKAAVERERVADSKMQGCPIGNPNPPSLPALQEELAGAHCGVADGELQGLYCTCLGSCSNPCDDANSCTTDTCSKNEALTCVPNGPAPCGCSNTPRMSGPCDDDNRPCTMDVCQNGKCEHPNLPNNTPCNNSSKPCEASGLCFNGTCIAVSTKCASDQLCFCTCNGSSSSLLECDFKQTMCMQKDELDGEVCTVGKCTKSKCECDDASTPMCGCVPASICPRLTTSTTTTVTTSTTSTTSSSAPTGR